LPACAWAFVILTIVFETVRGVLKETVGWKRWHKLSVWLLATVAVFPVVYWLVS
jgi:hypothetical protein